MPPLTFACGWEGHRSEGRAPERSTAHHGCCRRWDRGSAGAAWPSRTSTDVNLCTRGVRESPRSHVTRKLGRSSSESCRSGLRCHATLGLRAIAAPGASPLPLPRTDHALASSPPTLASAGGPSPARPARGAATVPQRRGDGGGVGERVGPVELCREVVVQEGQEIAPVRIRALCHHDVQVVEAAQSPHLCHRPPRQ